MTHINVYYGDMHYSVKMRLYTAVDTVDISSTIMAYCFTQRGGNNKCANPRFLLMFQVEPNRVATREKERSFGEMPVEATYIDVCRGRCECECGHCQAHTHT